MRKLKESRYDLVCLLSPRLLTSVKGFTRFSETNLLPKTLAIVAELPEITDTIFIPNKALLKAIEDSNEWFEYLVISDFPEETPKRSQVAWF